MGLRADIADALQAAWAFGKVVKNIANDVLSSDGEKGEAATPDCERWGDAALISRPPVGAETLSIQLGDERIILATRERRYSVTLEDGDAVVRAMGPGSPAYVRMRPNGDAQVVANAIYLGSASATDFVALASLVMANFNALKGFISSAATSPGDGGASFKAALVASMLTAWPTPIASTKTRSQ